MTTTETELLAEDTADPVSLSDQLKKLSAERADESRQRYAELLRREEFSADDKQQLAQITDELGVPFDDIDMHINAIRQVANLERKLQPWPTSDEHRAYKNQVTAIRKKSAADAIGNFNAVLLALPIDHAECAMRGAFCGHLEVVQGEAAFTRDSVLAILGEHSKNILRPLETGRQMIADLQNPERVENANQRRQKEIAQLKAKYPLAFPAETV
jgi:hypothetical protein